MQAYQIPLTNDLIIDNFAGGGGASTGIEEALGRPISIAINHDHYALGMHAANHPLTDHLCEDVFAVNPREVTQGRRVSLAWFSPDCKHHSKARGQKPVEKKIRGLAWVTTKWAGQVRPEVIMLENVEEFLQWCPLVAKRCKITGRVMKKDGSIAAPREHVPLSDQQLVPDNKKLGHIFKAFVKHLERLGYVVDWDELRACDYGAPTIRKRLFLIARCDGLPIVWPVPTHGPKGSGLLPYLTAADCIDWDIPCPSIFERKKPLAENTMRRIAKGIQKFVIENPEPFIVNLTHGARLEALSEPMNTVTCTNRGEKALVTPTLIQTGYGERKGQEPRALDIEKPVGTVVAGGVKHALVTPYLVEHANSSTLRAFNAKEPMRTLCAEIKGGHFALVSPVIVGAGGPARAGEPKSVEKPFITQTTRNHAHLCTAFLAQHNGQKGEPNPGRAASEPMATIVARGTQTQVVAAHIARHFGNSIGHRPGVPVGSQTSKSKDSLVTTHIAKLRGTCAHGQKADDPLHTVSAGGTHHAQVQAFLIKYYGSGDGKEPHGITKPIGSVTAKDRFGLVTIHGEEYQIVDIGMRMLTPRELYRAQSFPPDYIIEQTADGTKLNKTQQIRMCGNSVCRVLSKALTAANIKPTQLWMEAAE